MLTDRQRQILEYIRKCVKDKGYPPAVREIGKAVDYLQVPAFIITCTN